MGLGGGRNPNGCAPKTAQFNFSFGTISFVPTAKSGSRGGWGGGSNGCQPFYCIPAPSHPLKGLICFPHSPGHWMVDPPPPHTHTRLVGRWRLTLPDHSATHVKAMASGERGWRGRGGENASGTAGPPADEGAATLNSQQTKSGRLWHQHKSSARPTCVGPGREVISDQGGRQPPQRQGHDRVKDA